MISVFCLLLIASVGAQQSFRIDPSSGHFLDNFGRVRIFHGVNAVFKSAPWIPLTDKQDPFNSIVQADIDNLQNWGFNVVRLGVMWPGVEPTPSNYNLTYLEEINTLITNLGKKGIVTIADLHQDLLHPDYCGEGLPRHILNASSHACDSAFSYLLSLVGACKPFSSYNIPIDPSTNEPSLTGCLSTQFALFYSTPELSSAFENLYTLPALIDAFNNYWRTTSKALAKNDAVLGYDLLNEPWPGDIWNNPLLLLPGHADSVHLQNLYKGAHAAIRENDDNKIIFYEGVQFPDVLPILGGLISPNGFTDTPGGQSYNDRQALSYHVYCCGFGATNCDKSGDPTVAINSQCDIANAKKLNTRYADAKRLGGGQFMTEFGACSNSDQCVKEITRSADAADAQFGSWAYWQFKFFNDVTTQSGSVEGFYNADGSLQTSKLAALTRTYAQAVQGMPTNMTFNTVTKHFHLSYILRLSVTAPTVIFASSDFHYPSGFSVAILPCCQLTASITNRNFVTIFATAESGVPDGSAISIDIASA